MKTNVFNLLTLFQFTVWTLLTFSGSLAFAGGSDGGGGFQVPGANGRYVLLDFYLADKNFTDAYTHAPIQIGKLPLFTQTLGYDLYFANKIPATQLAMEHLEKWRAGSPRLIKMLSAMVTKTRWRFMDREMPEVRNNSYTLPWSLSSVFISPVPIVLFTKQLGPLACVKCWNRMGDLSQAGTLIHEGLRHAQVIKNILIDSKLIQDLTAKIALAEPSQGATLETEALLGKEFYRYIKTATDEELNMNFMLDYEIGGRANFQELMYWLFCQTYHQIDDDGKYIGERLYQIQPDKKQAHENLTKAIREYIDNVMNHFAE